MIDEGAKKSFVFNIVTLVKQVFNSEQVVEILAPGVDGEFGVLSLHKNMYSLLAPGVLVVHMLDSSTERFFVKGGYMAIQSAGCTAFVDFACALDSLDEHDLRRDIGAKEDVLRDVIVSGEDSTMIDKVRADIDLLNRMLLLAKGDVNENLS